MTWKGVAFGGVSADESTCEEGVNCETFVLNVSGSPADWSGKKVNVQIAWATGDTDYDLFVHKGEDPSGPLVGSSAQGGTTMEATSIDPAIVGTGKFSVRVVYFLGSALTDPYTGTAKVGTAPIVEPSPPPGASPTPTPIIPGAPRFHNFPAPPGVGEDAGEPSNGVNWKTEKTFSNSAGPIPNGGTSTYYGGFLPYMLKTTFNDCSSPAEDTWEQKQLTLVNAPRAFGDPILFTDSQTGRTFVSQELGLSPGGSTTEFTDDDGDTFFPSEGSGAPSGIDHQTIGGGPFAPGLGPITAYPNAVYYASQSIADAVCSVSIDGGITFGPAVPMYTIEQCSGLHGHLKVAPDGTVYVPNRACGGDLPFHAGGEVAVVVSEDNGLTWEVRPVKGSTTRGDRDPSVGIAKDGTVYLGWQAGNGHAFTAVSRDKGKTWTDLTDVGAQAGVKNIVFSVVVAGDGDRASYAFYGTERAGDDYDQPAFPGVWYLYHSSTFDRGKTWTTTNLTPNDPVQRGGICGDGTCRNLLDFFRSEIDKQGRVVIGWDDGCTGGCVSGPPNSFVAKAVIARQSGGKRMFAAKDPVEPAQPQAPAVTGSINPASTEVSLSWAEPDNSGSPITAYKVFRRAGEGGSFALVATVNQESYTDTTFDKNVKNFYRVTAVNAEGEGPYCNEFTPKVVAAVNVCVLPGALVIDDSNPDGSDADTGANVPIDERVNAKQLFVAEPPVGAGPNQLVFTLKVGESTSASAPPNSQWFIIWNRENPAADGSDRIYVAMRSDVTGAVSFEYGNFGPPLDPTNPPPNANSPTRVGDADAGTYDPATGVITIRIANSKVENKQAGKDLSGLNVRTYFNRPDPGQRSQNNASDITGDASYTLRGNASCVVANQAPLAAFIATPKKGRAHLEVSFDASASRDTDAGDSIAEYRFNFGDGTPDVIQNKPTLTHTYKRPGFFISTLTVKDTKGLKSLNIAREEIQTKETLLNLSSRARVRSGEQVSIGGFIITGDAPKKVILRGIGPSLKNGGAPVPGRLEDPEIELFNKNGVSIASNDNWKSEQEKVQPTGLAPKDNREAALVRTLAPGPYTVVLRGQNRSGGIGLVEVYDLALEANSRLANLSTRALVETGDNALIGGFIAGPTTAGGMAVVVRGIGPSLKPEVSGALNDPTLQLFNANGDMVGQNDNWKSDQQAAIKNTGLQPEKDAEAAILIPALSPGPYTAIMRGKGNSTGVGLVEVYGLE